MHKDIKQLSSLFQSLPEEKRYSYNYSILRDCAKNAISLMGLPPGFTFLKYFQCEAEFRNTLRILHHAYKRLLHFDTRGYSNTPDIETLLRQNSRHSVIMRCRDIQGYFMYNYKSPILLNKRVLSIPKITDSVLHSCVKSTIKRIQRGETITVKD